MQRADGRRDTSAVSAQPHGPQQNAHAHQPVTTRECMRHTYNALRERRTAGRVQATRSRPPDLRAAPQHATAAPRGAARPTLRPPRRPLPTLSAGPPPPLPPPSPPAVPFFEVGEGVIERLQPAHATPRTGGVSPDTNDRSAAASERLTAADRRRPQCDRMHPQRRG